MMFEKIPPMVVRPPKRIWVFFLVGVLVPGFGEIYLGDEFRKKGLLKLGTILLCFPLIFAWGLGLFLMVFLWFSNLFSIIAGVTRTLWMGD